ncbi:IS110 family transposase [Brevundimonas sp. SL130]|uniref:IS110 family transposase n=1 Tax=Brevundimonas sp. SL130 TaxID=2995143 RepID=UPI00226CCB0A|nr:IS110 family transposase [Brevundimonas sp. SL130]WAC59130.1 IS110 family transposase [Brevundimonas sp. SL130]WAC59360.1 IS110 family transposase [Brevundimonas sp. SL130]WAC59853.1 IS110 family transposase [Brevundimonas sp. SL130]
MTQDRVFVGIDVSKARLDVALTTGEAWSVSNDRAGWRALVDQLQTIRPEAVGLEPSGGYERGLVEALTQAGLAVRRVEAGRVRAFAGVLGLKAKTDLIDAQLIARFVQTLPGRTVEPNARAQALAELVDARRALCEEQVRVRNQAEQVRDPMLRRMAARRLNRMKADVVLLEKRLAATVAADPDLAERDRLMRSVPGVGPVLSWTLMAHLPELGRLSHKQIAALVGVAPYDRQSGSLKGRSMIRGGRAVVRNVAYMAALIGARHNPVLAAMKQRLAAKGKPGKVILVALINKLMTLLNAVVRDRSEWRIATH